MEEICRELNIVGTQALTYEYIPLFKELLDVNIYVINSALGNAFSYISQNHDIEHEKIFLYHGKENESSHFHAITKISGFFTQSYFCTDCLKPYEKHFRHKFAKHCNVCFSDDCIEERIRICSDCNRSCGSLDCF